MMDNPGVLGSVAMILIAVVVLSAAAITGDTLLLVAGLALSAITALMTRRLVRQTED